jgi:glutathione S-transferase
MSNLMPDLDPGTALTLHGTALSGHSHRVVLLLRMLRLPYRFVDAPRDARTTPAFLALNPLGQIPVLQDGDLVLADSNAILIYLARLHGAAGAWLPRDPLGQARVQRFLSLAAGEVMHGPATARAIVLWDAPGDLERACAIAARLLRFLEDHLSARRFLAADTPTIADLACYSYVAHAPEGRISLELYASVRAWLGRVEGLDGFVPMPRSEIPAS